MKLELPLTPSKTLRGQYLTFSKIKPIWWNTVFISSKSEWIVFQKDNRKMKKMTISKKEFNLKKLYLEIHMDFQTNQKLYMNL